MDKHIEEGKAGVSTGTSQVTPRRSKTDGLLRKADAVLAGGTYTRPGRAQGVAWASCMAA